jgi:hypothetical protein
MARYAKPANNHSCEGPTTVGLFFWFGTWPPEFGEREARSIVVGDRGVFQPAMIAFLFFGLFSLAAIALLTLWAVTRAPTGYEDATGFHYGEVDSMNTIMQSEPSQRGSTKQV